jgi:hypothetical protein
MFGVQAVSAANAWTQLLPGWDLGRLQEIERQRTLMVFHLMALLLDAEYNLPQQETVRDH